MAVSAGGGNDRRMKCVIQRVRRASVSIVVPGGDAAAPIVREIGPGLAVLAGFEKGDTEEDRRWCAAKIVGLRIFEDDAGKMNRSVDEVTGGGILLVPNFTLAGDLRKGRRPSFDNAMEPGLAATEFERFVDDVRALAAAASAERSAAPGGPANPPVRIERGEFRAAMLVTIENDGPITMIVDSRARAAQS